MAAYFRQTGTGAMRVKLDPGRGFQLEEVRLHLSAAGGSSENFTTTVQSAAGDEYNAVLNTQDMNAATDEHYQPTRPVFLAKGDTLLFEWANSNTKTWGLEVVWS